MAYIHLYKDNPTPGDIDGTQVSEGTGGNPISVILNANINEESSPIKLSLRCDTGYQTAGDTIVMPRGTSAAKWALAPDNNGSPGDFGNYGDSLTIATSIGATNTIFWAKVKATPDEVPRKDTSVDLKISTTIQSV